MYQSGRGGTVRRLPRRAAGLSRSAKIRSALAVAALVLGSREALAEPKLFVRLDYQADPTLDGCPTDDAFRSLVSTQLQYDPFRTDADHQVVARAERAEQGIRGFVRWYDASGAQRGERELQANDRDCAAFAKAMSFAIAVQVQLMITEDVASDEARAKEPPAAAEPPKEPAPERRPRSSTPAPPADAPEPDERGGTEYLLGLGPGVSVGLTPAAVAEGRVAAGVRWGRLGLEIGGEASLPSRRETEPGRGFEQRLALGTLAGCVSFGVLFGCALQKLGAVEVQGFGVDVPQAPAGLIALSGIRLGAGDRFGSRWFGSLRVDVLATLTRWEVELDGQAVWKPPPVSLTLGADVAAIFR